MSLGSPLGITDGRNEEMKATLGKLHDHAGVLMRDINGNTLVKNALYAVGDDERLAHFRGVDRDFCCLRFQGIESGRYFYLLPRTDQLFIPVDEGES